MAKLSALVPVVIVSSKNVYCLQLGKYMYIWKFASLENFKLNKQAVPGRIHKAHFPTVDF
jgi:hypothetical protein